MDQKKIILNTDDGSKSQNTDSSSANMDKAINENSYAGELPSWDLLPPAVVIRRVKRSI